MKVIEFRIEPSKVNTQGKVLVAVAEDGSRWVVSGDHWNPSQLEPYDSCFHTKGEVVSSQG